MKVKQSNDALIESERIRSEMYHELHDLSKDIDVYRREVGIDQEEKKRLKQLVEAQKEVI